MCGGRKLECDNGFFCEAEIMKRKVLEMGIPEKDILLEELSLTTKENMLCALLMLEREFKLSNVNKILLVTANYHMRISLSMVKMYMPSWMKFIPCPSEDIETQRNT